MEDQCALRHSHVDLGGLLGTLANEGVHVDAGATGAQQAEAGVVDARKDTLMIC